MEAIMIVGVFDDATEARIAAQKLADCGIDPDAIRIKGGTGSTIDLPVRGPAGTIRSFFAKLFSVEAKEDDHRPDDFPGDYAEAVRRGGTVLLVDSRGDEETDRIVATLEESGAIDIDERLDLWRNAGYSRHDETAAPYSEEEAALERARYRLGGAPVADEAREANAERRRRVRMHRFTDAETAVYGTKGSASAGTERDERDDRADTRQAERSSAREAAMASGGDDDARARRATDVGGAEATGAAWSAAPGQRRSYDGPERRSTIDTPYTGVERRGPAQ